MALINMFLDLIIGVLCFNFLFEQCLKYLNFCQKKKPLPDAVKHLYDSDRQQHARAYQKIIFRFEIVTSIVSFVLVMVLLSGSYFGELDGWIRSFVASENWVTVIFFGTLFMANHLLMLPFEYYYIFVIEENFGFNSTTRSIFLIDNLKKILLTCVLGVPFLLVLHEIYYRYVNDFWWMAAIFIFGLSFLASIFYTSLILPLFNKLVPLDKGELRSAIETYALTQHFDIKNIYLMDGSKRSSKANAFFSGWGSGKKIILFDTLVNEYPIQEVVAVLAHEVGHYKKKHMSKGLFISAVHAFLLFYILSFFLGSIALTEAIGSNVVSFHISVLGFSLLYSPVSMLTSLAGNLLSRKHEYEADAFAKNTASGEDLGKALTKLTTDNLSELNPHPLYVFIHYSHPPLKDRLKALGYAEKTLV